MEPRYIILYALGELCEMTGLILWIRTLLRGFDANGRVISLGLVEKP